MFRLLQKAVIRHRLKKYNRKLARYNVYKTVSNPLLLMSYIMPVPEDGFLQNSKHAARF